jgi:biotin transport system substrate-specific component
MIAGMTVADLVRPSEKGLARLYDAAVVVGGSIVIALCAQVAVGGPVPITGQTFGLLMVAALLGSRRAVLCVLTYLAEGLLGLPVFAQGGAGLGVILGPRGGYLIGFLAAVYVVGSLAEHGWDRRPATTVLAMVLGNLGLYACGLTWLFCLVHVFARPLGGHGLLAVGLYPFLAGDAVKIALAAILLPAGWKIIRHFGLDANPQHGVE